MRQYSKKVKTHTTFVPCISDEYIALICSIALRKTKEIKKYINLILKKETKKTLIFEKIKILRYYYCIENNKHTRKNIEKKFGNEITNKVFNQFLTGNTFEKLIKEIKLLNLKINHKYEFEINKIRRNL